MNRLYVESAVILGLATVMFVLAAEFEAFEWFYEFSRAHEDWELDEAFSFFIATSFALPALLYNNRRHLATALHEKKKTEENAQNAARHDPLTGLRNRRDLMERLETAVDDAGQSGQLPMLMILDLDRFKPINDLRGHAVGDKVLQKVAQRISNCCKQGQSPVRLGGDEFAILLWQKEDSLEGLNLARCVRDQIAREMDFGDFSASISCSIGVALWQDGVDALGMLRNADQAMYRAKKHGTGEISFYNTEMGKALAAQAKIEADLRNAIEDECIQPYFQPIIGLKDGSLSGFEVLARWVREDDKLICPATFIPVAESCGLIGPLTWSMLRQACDIATQWDLPIPISVNISSLQLPDPKFCQNVKTILEETGLEPERLVLEVTESVLISEYENVRELFFTLEDLGVGLSLDDFGTGYSSLALLNVLPFQNVKIDRSFVMGVADNPQSAKIIDGILALAQSLGLTVTAEGIEKTEELAFLMERDCPNGQGFLFERPMPASEVEEFIFRQTEREQSLDDVLTVDIAS